MVVLLWCLIFGLKSLCLVIKMAYNVSQISEGTNSVGIVRLDLGFCLCAVMRGAFNKLKL
jgi:hypothetical protein